MQLVMEYSETRQHLAHTRWRTSQSAVFESKAVQTDSVCASSVKQYNKLYSALRNAKPIDSLFAKKVKELFWGFL